MRWDEMEMEMGERERFHTDHNRAFQTLIGGSKSMGFTSSRDLPRETGMWSQLPPNFRVSSLCPEEIQPVYLEDHRGDGQAISHLCLSPL